MMPTWGSFAPTAVQTDKMAQTVALLVTALGLQLTIDTVMTHCEAALLDGYGLTAATPKHAGTCGICAIHPATDR